MWDLIVLIPDHCLSIYFMFVLLSIIFFLLLYKNSDSETKCQFDQDTKLTVLKWRF